MPPSRAEGSARGQRALHHKQQRIKRQLDRALYRVPLSFKRQHVFESLFMRSVGGDAESPLEDWTSERPRLDPFVNNPTSKNEKPMLRVCFTVSFRCHSRQLLCMGGSQFPFGWSFVSIAKLPMTWNPKDRWTAEVGRRHSLSHTSIATRPSIFRSICHWECDSSTNMSYSKNRCAEYVMWGYHGRWSVGVDQSAE